MDEIWLPIAGYGDCYAVSNLGHVKRVVRRQPWRAAPTHRPSRAVEFSPSFVKSFVNRDGYPQVRIGPAGAQKSARVHRLVAEAFVPNPNMHSVVNHKDGDKQNNRPENLEWTTYSANSRHAYELRLITPKSGAANGMSKLTEDQKEEIRRDTRIAREVAADYGVHLTRVYQLRKVS